MNDYTPGWQFVFPEQGDPYRSPSTGPRCEAATCYECGRAIERPSAFDATCGADACRIKALQRSQR